MRQRSVTVILLAAVLGLTAAPVLASPASAATTHHSAGISDDSGSPRRIGDHRPGKRRVVVLAHGRVSAVDASAGTLTLTLRADRELTGTVSATTVVRLDGAKATLADLAAGDRVVVQGYSTGTAVTLTRITARTPTASA